MPSDAMDAVREALAAPLDEFRSTLVSSLEEVRGMLSDVGRTDEDRAAELTVELGPFAVGRIDTGALTAVLSEKQVLAPDAEAVIGTATEALTVAALDLLAVPGSSDGPASRRD